MKNLSMLHSTYINLNENELIRLSKELENPDKPIDWLNIIDRSQDPDPLRAKAIDKARIRSAMRYHEKGGPKKNYGAKTKKSENVMSRNEVRRRGL
tara:strand:- start:2199 stop:2486 length:288 start_codon:yes stop_codon:yes gene_type:complete